jgi:hypothetical protein
VKGDAQLQVNLCSEVFSRLAKMRRLPTLVLAFALGIAAAVSLASCGGGEGAKLLPGATAQEITENLDRVKQYAEEGECVGAADAAGEVSAQVEALSGVDPKLKQALQSGAARLGEVISSCEETTEAVAPASEATTERSEPPGQEKKAEKEQEKEEKEAEKQEPQEPPTTPAETTPEEPPVPPTESGGTGAPGGVSPGAPAAPGGE